MLFILHEANRRLPARSQLPSASAVTCQRQVFKDTFDIKNPVIFYSSHADFQQTNTVSSMISTYCSLGPAM